MCYMYLKTRRENEIASHYVKRVESISQLIADQLLQHTVFNLDIREIDFLH